MTIKDVPTRRNATLQGQNRERPKGKLTAKAKGSKMMVRKTMQWLSLICSQFSQALGLGGKQRYWKMGLRLSQSTVLHNQGISLSKGRNSSQVMGTSRVDLFGFWGKILDEYAESDLQVGIRKLLPGWSALWHYSTLHTETVCFVPFWHQELVTPRQQGCSQNS
jgi:hypothetical protein